MLLRTDRTVCHRPRPSAPLSLSAVLAVFCLFSTAQRPAVAADNKAYPGSMCQPFSGAPDIEVDGGNSAIWNTSATNSRTVSCPFVRDNTINFTGAAGDLWVYVNRSGVNADPLTCTFYSTSASNGATVYQFSRNTTAVGAVRLNIPITSSTSPGPYSMLCSLPPQSVLYAYLLPEF